jgi:hypothetical protein
VVDDNSWCADAFIPFAVESAANGWCRSSPLAGGWYWIYRSAMFESRSAANARRCGWLPCLHSSSRYANSMDTHE